MCHYQMGTRIWYQETTWHQRINVGQTSNDSGGFLSGVLSSKANCGPDRLAPLACPFGTPIEASVASGWTAGSKSMNSPSSSGRRSVKINMPLPPANVSEVTVVKSPEGGVALDMVVADTGRTGWYRPSGGNDMCVSCAGVTREKFGRISKMGSVFLAVLEVEALLSSARFDMERLIGEISPSLAGDGSSTSISRSPSDSFFVSS